MISARNVKFIQFGLLIGLGYSIGHSIYLYQNYPVCFT